MLNDSKILWQSFMKCSLVGMLGMVMGTKGLVVVGFRVGRDSLGEAAAEGDWIGVKGDENLRCDSMENIICGPAWQTLCMRDIT